MNLQQNKSEPNLKNLVEIKLNLPDDFLKIAETLTRIGIKSAFSNTLTQSCHILHKRAKYYIVHFKELFELDGKETTFTEDDKARRNTISFLLEKWKLCTIVNPVLIEYPKMDINELFIIPNSEKNRYNLVSKYTIGKKF